MSKRRVSFPLALIVLLQILQFVNNSNAQRLNARITIASGSTKAEISGQYSGIIRPNPRNLFFVDQYASIPGLAERISQLSLFDLEGKPVKHKRFMAGEYEAEADFSSWKYTVDMNPLTNPTAGAHASWLNGEIGVLRLRDILPNAGLTDSSVRIELPSDCTPLVSITWARDCAGREARTLRAG